MFFTIIGNAVNHIAPLKVNWRVDTTFNTGTGANYIIYTILTQANNKTFIVAILINLIGLKLAGLLEYTKIGF